MDNFTTIHKMPPMKAYSYVRWSSDDQTKGDSLDRQLEITKNICAENDWHLDESLTPDQGISAYKGDNINKGSLAGFIAAVEAKRILTPCVLVVEALDRLTRAKLRDARNLFERLLEMKVQICTANNRKVYTEECLDNPFDIMMSLMEMNAAHEYSKNIGRRSRAAWKRKKDRARTGIVLTRKLPAWISLPKGAVSTEFFAVQDEKAEIVRRVFREYLSGIGTRTIALNLTKERVKPFGCATEWNVSSIFRLLKSISVIGQYQPQIHRDKRTRTDEGATIENYYPAIIDEKTFYRTQEQMRQKLIPRGPKKNCYNLFSGLMLCKKCRSQMVLKSGAFTKDRKTPYMTIVCSKAWRGGKCKYTAIPYRTLEETLLQVFSTLVVTKMDSPENTAEARLYALQGELANVETQIAKFMKAAEELKEIPRAFVNKVNTLEKRQLEIKEEMNVIPTDFEKYRLQSLLENWKPMEPTRENRQKMQTLFRSLVERIEIDPKIEQAEIFLKARQNDTPNVVKWKKLDPTYLEINTFRIPRAGGSSGIWLTETK